MARGSQARRPPVKVAIKLDAPAATYPAVATKKLHALSAADTAFLVEEVKRIASRRVTPEQAEELRKDDRRRVEAGEAEEVDGRLYFTEYYRGDIACYPADRWEEPPGVRVRLHRAWMLVSAGAFNKARPLFIEALKLHPKRCSEALYGLASISFDNHRRACSLFERADKIDPYPPGLLYLRGVFEALRLNFNVAAGAFGDACNEFGYFCDEGRPSLAKDTLRVLRYVKDREKRRGNFTPKVIDGLNSCFESVVGALPDRHRDRLRPLVERARAFRRRLNGFPEGGSDRTEAKKPDEISDLVTPEPGYTPDAGGSDAPRNLSTVIMDKATAYEVVAADKGLSSGTEVHQAIDYWQAAKKEHTARETADRAKAEPRPQWENRTGDDADLSPPEFIAKHYAAEMAAGTLHRGVIAQEDKPLAVKLPSWLRSHAMPEGIDIPTKPEWITRELAKRGVKVVSGRRTVIECPEEARLYDAARMRTRRQIASGQA